MGSTGLTELSANLESEFCHYQPCRKSCTSVGTGDIRWTFANKYTKNGHFFPQTVTKCNGKKITFMKEKEKKEGRKQRKGRKKRKDSLFLDILMKIMYWGLYRYSNRSFIGSI